MEPQNGAPDAAAPPSPGGGGEAETRIVSSNKMLKPPQSVAGRSDQTNMTEASTVTAKSGELGDSKLKDLQRESARIEETLSLIHI